MRFIVNAAAPLNPNPAFELPENWTTVAMNDDGTGDDLLGGDGFAATPTRREPGKAVFSSRQSPATPANLPENPSSHGRHNFTHTSSRMSAKRFRIAFSFAGEKREFVEKADAGCVSSAPMFP